ncbi:MAG: chromosomal replication initiator DnaA [Gemmobacter sp.]
MRQLPLDLPVPEARGRGDFVVTPSNAAALAALDAWQGWPGGRMVLVGPPGSGKTHLAHVWAATAGAAVMGPSALGHGRVPLLAAAPLALDDADRIAGDSAQEAALFHLMNLAAENRQPLLLTARRVPRDWGAGLPDLVSRLMAAPLARIAPPDDALLVAVMTKLFADRQLRVAPGLVLWLAARMHRSLGHARRLVAALDAQALATRRPIGPEMAREVLGRLAVEGD